MKKFLVFLIVGLLASSAAWGATIAITANAASKLEVSVDSDTWTIALDNTGAAYEDAGQGALTVKSSKSAYTVTSRHEQRYSCEGNDYNSSKVKVDTTDGRACDENSARTPADGRCHQATYSSRNTTAASLRIGFKIEAILIILSTGRTRYITISLASKMIHASMLFPNAVTQ